MPIFDDITARLNRENNIKHKTLNTKHETLNTNTLDLPSGESSALRGLRPTSGLASLSASQDIPPQVEVSNSGEVIPALVNSDFQYIAVTVKTQESEERISVNVDFRLQNSQVSKFNKLIFDLVGWTRRREFFANIPAEITDWQGYRAAYSQQDKAGFIGKGRPRQTKQKGSSHRTPLRAETSMLLSSENGLTCHLWIEDAYLVIPVYAWNDHNNYFCAKGEYVNNPGSQYIKRGGWL